MVLEHRRTIICKSGSIGIRHVKTKTDDKCTKSTIRSKREHHMAMRQNQCESGEDNSITQTDLIEISLANDLIPHQTDVIVTSDSYLLEQLLEQGKSGDLRAFQRVCTRMLQCHLRLDAPGYMGWTAAHWAAREGHVHLLEYLTICRANLDVVDRKGDTLLHKAAANGQSVACEWLLERGFSVKKRNNNHLTPLDLAQEHVATSRRNNSALVCERVLFEYWKKSGSTADSH